MARSGYVAGRYDDAGVYSPSFSQTIVPAGVPVVLCLSLHSIKLVYYREDIRYIEPGPL